MLPSDFKAKMQQSRFCLAVYPRYRGGNLLCFPDPLAGFNGLHHMVIFSRQQPSEMASQHMLGAIR